MIRAHCYAIAYTFVECPHCTEVTPVIALCVPPGHEALDAEEEARAAADFECWSRIAYGAFLFHVAELPDHVAQRMQSLHAGYRRAVGSATRDACWANHCASCGVPLEDHDLYCEPEGAFMPLTLEAAAPMCFEFVADALQVWAGGHAEIPPALEILAVQ